MYRAAAGAFLSHWRRHPVQLATLLIGLSLATALWSGVQAINAEARASYGRAASVLDQDRLAQLVARDGRLISVDSYAKLRRAGWLVSPVIEGELRLGREKIRLIGIEPLTMPPEGQKAETEQPGGLLEFLSPGVLLVSPATAKKLQGETQVKLRLSDQMPDGAAFADISVADRLLARSGLLNRLVVSPQQRIDPDALRRIAPDLTVREVKDRPDVAQLTDSFHLNLTAFGFLAFAVGLFIVYAAIGLAFEQRRGTVRTVRALGLSLQAITVTLMIEVLALALFAGVAGVILGYFMASLLLPGVAATLKGLYGADVPGTLALRPQWWAAGLGMAVTGTLISSAQSLWRVRHMPLLASALPRAWARASATGARLQLLAGLILVAVAALLGMAGAGLAAGFATLGCFLLGSALLLPALLSSLLGLMQSKSSHPLAIWFWADTRQQLPGLSLALMALLLALSANVGVGTMVSSFRLTFVGWLDQRLAAELYVTARDEDEASRLRAWLRDRGTTFLPIWNVEGEVLGEKLQIYGVADDATYREHWPVLLGERGVWDLVATRQAALVNEQLWRRKGIKTGDRLEMPGGWSVAVAGVYSDYGNPKGQVIIGINSLVEHYPDVSRLRYGLRAPPQEVATLMQDLVTQFGLPAEAIVDQATLKQQSRGIFEQTFAVTGALNAFTLAVAGFAMFSSLLTLSGIRLPQLAPVWAMGVTRRDLVKFEVARTLALWLATFLAALPVGLVLAWVLLSIINVEAFGWRLPMHVFPWDWLWLALVALAAAGVSVLIPLRRLMAVGPSDLLRTFANER